MGYVVKMPKLGFEMESGELIEWKVSEGDAVDTDQILAEIEVEKSTAEIESRESGVLRKILCEEGKEGPPGMPVAIVAEPDADISELEEQARSELNEIS